MISKTISHYKILEMLGEGGMGVVYKAQDTKLDRIVALKFLPKHLLCDESAKTRFEHEAKAASALNHTNITTIYEIDEVEGECFICMEYVESKSITELIKEKTLSITEVLNISVQIAEGLNAAHKKGIVHRDIKSDNIMLTAEGLVKIMDFGLAKLRGVSRVTKEGTTLGTMPYMSPEQVQGMEVDQRSDIFSFGVVLYEMIAGQLPFKGEHEAAIIYSILNETPEPLARYKSNVPGELQRVIEKALAKGKDERYQHVDEMMVDLKYIKKKLETTTTIHQPGKPKLLRKVSLYIYASVAILIVILILSKLYFFASREVPINSIAVLPFQNLSADPEQEYFSDGITEALISELSKIKALRVISRTSVMRFKKTEKSLPEIAHDLNVDAVVEGSVQRVQDDIRITAQLIKAEPEKHLWADDFTKKFKDILILQSEVAQAIAREIKITVTPEEQQQLLATRTVNPEAQEAYLKGRFFVNKFNEADVRKGISYFEQAIAKDSSYALAYEGLAEGYDYLWNLGVMSAKDAFPKIKTWAMKALSIDETLAGAYAMIGDIESAEWNWQGGEENFKRAIGLNQNYAAGHAYYAWYLSLMKRYDEALSEAKRGVEVDPLWPMTKLTLAWTFFFRYQYDSAMIQVNEALSIDSTFVLGYVYLGDFYLWEGNFGEAIAQYQKAAALGYYSVRVSVAWAYARAGNAMKAREILADLKTEYIAPAFLAILHMDLGERDRAFEYLERAYEENDVYLLLSVSLPRGFDPSLDSLRTDPRFHALVKKIGFEEIERRE